MQIPEKQIRAVYGEKTIRVYQAYNHEIADTALDAGRFVSPPFKLTRMTWIKPSFLWMMYRSGWGMKDAGQARILAIDMSLEGFEWALLNSCLSHCPDSMSKAEWSSLKETSSVRIQWDPERDIELEKLDYRSIQIGLTGVAVEKYVSDWIQGVTDVTELARFIQQMVESGERDKAKKFLPQERPYNLSSDVAKRLGVIL